MPRTRTLEIWHIPKRQNIHQIIGAVEILTQDNFHGKSWTRMKQENFNTQLGRAGITINGKPLSPSARRTLEALIKYLGFIYIDNSTPIKSLHVTPAGFDLIKAHGSIIGKYKNLREVQLHKQEITESEIVKEQFLKLQISNPSIKEDCNNITLFPFRITLQLLHELDYLSKEEIAYYLFSMKDKMEYAELVKRIQAYRALSNEEQHALITAFKQTDIGNLTLVQAPTAIYYMGLCAGTGLCERIGDNLRIKAGKMAEVTAHLSEFDMINPFAFADNFSLWIDYIGNRNRLIPPTLCTITVNAGEESFYLIVKNKDKKEMGAGVISKQQPIFSLPLFLHEQYEIEIFRFSDGVNIKQRMIDVTQPLIQIELEENINTPPLQQKNTIVEKIHALIASKELDAEYLQHLSILKRITGKENFNIAQLRGGRLEYLFFQFLLDLKEKGEIDDVYWNGRVSDTELYYPALGGKNGMPDIYFFIDDYLFILELTTIRSGDMQWKAEGASVHDHIRNLSQTLHSSHKIIGLFSAPTISPRIENMFKHISAHDNLPHIPITIPDLIEILQQGKASIVKNFLAPLCSKA